MAAFSNDAKNSSTFSNDAESAEIIAGTATGLLTPPTYAVAFNETTWANDTKN